MILTDYTTYNEVRAALGVSADDLEDVTLALALYANLLQADLEDVNIDLPATYATVKALTTPSAAQTRFLQAANVFATYAVAKRLTSSLPLFAAKQVTDSKAGVTRFDNPYKDVIAEVGKSYEQARNRLSQALGAIGSSGTTSTARVFLSVVSPGYDPITNA